MEVHGRGSTTGEAHSSSPVISRQVFYLSGFDPQGASRYHALYKSGAAAQSAVAGYAISVGARERIDRLSSRWTVEHQGRDGGRCRTQYHFLTWDDIVRRHWPREAWRVAHLTVSSTWHLLINGVLWRILQTSWAAFLALIVPGLLLLGMVMTAALALGIFVSLMPASPWVGAVSGAMCLVGAWWGGRTLQQWSQSAWLMRSTRVILKQARGELPDLERRLDDFADRLADALDASFPQEEILVVGHSSGAMLAASVVARAIERHKLSGERMGRLSLLTLGECIPMLSYQPEAQVFRNELARLRRCQGLCWIDFTAPPDGCCFALIDPTEVCEDRTGNDAATSLTGDAPGPKRLSPRFADLFSPASYSAIRRDKYRCHFQYLMATERPGAYDFFAITSGTVRLRERYAAVPSVTGFRKFQRFGSPRR